MLGCVTAVVIVASLAQFDPPPPQQPTTAQVALIEQKLNQLNSRIAELKQAKTSSSVIADIAISAKAAEWILRHSEYYDLVHADWAVTTLDTGLDRANHAATGKTQWFPREGSTVLGYVSQVDESVQPYAITLPRGYESNPDRVWPLHVELHGRNAKLNEVSFFHQWQGKEANAAATWIQLDVFGRTNNAYRWAGEADVFEALADLKRRVRIDEGRITLRGFSMGGAGTWHLGLHYPSLWSSIGAGAGFVDTVHHLKLESPLSPLHQKLIKIYDAQEYALNAFNVPTIGYGGELDAQLFAAKTMHAKGEELRVPIKLLIGPQTAHKFHPDSLKEFMKFIGERSDQGRPSSAERKAIKFITYTLKYNQCDWLTIDGQIEPYAKTTIEAEVDSPQGRLRVKTENVSSFKVLREIGREVIIDGGEPLAAPQSKDDRPNEIAFEKSTGGWRVIEAHRANPAAGTQSDSSALRKRHNLQGPIDDAFMQPFVCVRPTGTAWSKELTDWASWTLDRFEREYDKYLRGKIRIVDDTQVSEELLAAKNLILFGDPGSNRVLAKIVGNLPVKWTKHEIEFSGHVYGSTEHGLAMIFPNPLNPHRYVVVNSGHTFHEPDFKNSNANLYPRLGDFGVIQFARQPDGRYNEKVLFSDLFDSNWRWKQASAN